MLISAKIQEAIEKGHMDCVKVLFQIQDCWSSWPGTLSKALVEAVRKGQFSLVKYLFKLKRNWFLGDLHLSLSAAMIYGHTRIMEFLKASVVNVDGQTPLILATIQKDVNMVNFILQAGADVNKTNLETRRTALIEAVLNGCTKIAIVLIKAGANVNAVDKFGHTALMLAVRERNLKVAEVLNIVDILIKAGADLNIVDKNGETALILAIRKGYVKIVKALVAGGTDVNTADHSGNSALILAARKQKLKMTKVLIKAGAEVDKPCSEGLTALSYYALEGSEEGVKMVLEAGAKVNTNCFKGKTALLHCASGMLDYDVWKGLAPDLGEAIMNRRTKIAILLVKAGADVNISDNSGNTALMLAVRKINLKMGEVLIKAGAKVDEFNVDGLTNLPQCDFNFFEEFVRKLVKAGADIKTFDESSDSNLTLTAQKEYLYITKYFVEAGANVNKICVRDTTTLLRFALNGNERGVRLLLRSGARVNMGKKPTGLLEQNVRLLLDAAGQQMTTSQRNNKKFLKDTLHGHCREAIRRHLLNLDPHENLFLRIPRLGLPSLLAKYLLLDLSLD